MKKWFSIFLIFPLLFLQSCDLVSTREPEEPDKPRTDYIIPLTPQDLIQNLKDSFRDKDVQNYRNCFADTNYLNKRFVFEPSAGSILKYNVLNSWSIQNEEQYFRNLKSKIPDNATLRLEFINDEMTPFSDSTAYTARYALYVPSNDEKLPEYFQGNLKFIMKRDSRSQWVITYWQDVADEKFPGWSELKGRLFY